MPDVLKPKKQSASSKVFNQDIATTFVNSDLFAQDLVYMKNYDLFFMYTENKYYRKLEERDFQQIVLRFCEANFSNQSYTMSTIDDIVSLIKLKCLREATQEDRQYVAFNDVLYNTRTFKTEVFDRAKMVTYKLNYNFKQISTPTPVFDNFLETSLVEKEDTSVPDKELINLVQEMFGFFFTDSMKATGAFFLYGIGSNGKGIFSKVIEKMIGLEYISNLSLSNMGEKFSLVDIINKKVNISNEEDERFASSKAFKAIVTNDRIRGEFKFGAGVFFYPTIKLLFSTNKIPTFDGFDYGLKRRIFIIPFYKKFSPKEQDKDLFDKLTLEIPGIIGWAIEGARRLAKQDFTFSASSASGEVFKDFEEEMSGAIHYFRENYEVDNTDFVSKSAMYSHYLEWCRLNGKKGNYSKKRFGKELHDNVEGLNEKWGRDGVTLSSTRGYNCRFSPRDDRNPTVLINGVEIPGTLVEEDELTQKTLV